MSSIVESDANAPPSSATNVAEPATVPAPTTVAAPAPATVAAPAPATVPATATVAAPAPAPAAGITLRIKDQAGEETYFKVKNTTKMSKVFAAYAQRKGLQQSALRFLLDGERVTNDDTPKTLELEEEDQIDCLLEQYGGSGDGMAEKSAGSDAEAPAAAEKEGIIVRSFGGPYSRELMIKWTALSRKEGMYWTHRNCDVCHQTALIFSSHENAYTAGNLHGWNGWTCPDHSREYTVCRYCTTLHHNDSFRSYKGEKCCQWCFEKDTNFDAKLIQKIVRGFLCRQGRRRVTFATEHTTVEIEAVGKGRSLKLARAQERKAVPPPKRQPKDYWLDVFGEARKFTSPTYAALVKAHGQDRLIEARCQNIVTFHQGTINQSDFFDIIEMPPFEEDTGFKRDRPVHCLLHCQLFEDDKETTTLKAAFEYAVKLADDCDHLDTDSEGDEVMVSEEYQELTVDQKALIEDLVAAKVLEMDEDGTVLWGSIDAFQTMVEEHVKTKRAMKKFVAEHCDGSGIAEDLMDPYGGEESDEDSEDEEAKHESLNPFDNVMFQFLEALIKGHTPDFESYPKDEYKDEWEEAERRYKERDYEIKKAPSKRKAESDSEYEEEEEESSDEEDDDEEESQPPAKRARLAGATPLTKEEMKALFESGQWGSKNSEEDWKRKVNQILSVRDGKYPSDWYEQVVKGTLFKE